MNEEKILLQLKYIKEQVDDIAATLRGDPGDVDKPGLFTRVDRLEQSKKAHNRILWTIIGGGVTAVATVLGAILVRYLL